jgi:trans-aconitate methyltransferase
VKGIRKIIALNIQEFISSLPQSVVNSEDISIPDNVIRKLFRFADLCKTDVFFDLRCGNSNAVKIAAKEFKVKESVGIEFRKTLVNKARKKIIGIKNAEIINADVNKASFSDATVILFWFTDIDNIQQVIEKFESELKNSTRIITIWSPPDLMLPTKTEFPFFICQKPFKYAKNIKEQIEAIYGNPCIDFTASWLLAEKYIDALEVVPAKYHRFVNMFQSMIIWINAWNIGVSCEEEIPPPVQTYIGILKTFFNIDLTDMISKTH